MKRPRFVKRWSWTADGMVTSRRLHRNHAKVGRYVNSADYQKLLHRCTALEKIRTTSRSMCGHPGAHDLKEAHEAYDREFGTL